MGWFDFNGDGKTTWDEEYLAFKMFQKWAEGKESDLDNDFNSDPPEEERNDDKYEWRQNCEDDFEYEVDPEDYETEEEYEEALTEARERESSIEMDPDVSEEYVLLDNFQELEEENYPNKRRYNADVLLAANYLAQEDGFLYAQAIKENFNIPCALPREDESRNMEFPEILCIIAKQDIPLSFEVWAWGLEQFLPYAGYDDSCGNDLSVEVFDNLYSFPEGYLTKLVHYMSENDRFFKVVIRAGDEPSNSLYRIIVEAIQEGLFKIADALFEEEIRKFSNDGEIVNNLVEEMICCCKNYKELESMEYFRDNLLPKVKENPMEIIQSKIEEWEKDVAEYIDDVEGTSQKYAFTRKYAWRKNVPDGSDYNLNPLYYDTEEKYLREFNDRKSRWRFRL